MQYCSVQYITVKYKYSDNVQTGSDVLVMQSQQEITVAHWHNETQKGYIRIAMLILLGKKPYHGHEIARRRNLVRIGG
jgi:hypothetical protein